MMCRVIKKNLRMKKNSCTIAASNAFRSRSCPLAFQGVGCFLNHLSNRNVALVRLRIDEIERIPPQPDVKLMIPARGLALAASGNLIRRNRGD
jgi:hypothetical protein